MLSRRQFVQTIAAASVASRRAVARPAEMRFGPLRADPAKILDLPEGFSCRVVARQGEEMDDGLLMPSHPDGMAAFANDDGTVTLICNHENHPQTVGPFGSGNERLSRLDRDRIYDFGDGITPGTGGTTTLIYSPEQGRTLRRFLSLAGTELNCAGGATPWGSWLSCEECVSLPGRSRRSTVSREKRHGYVFEVAASATGPVEPKPLVAMGRFKHEACAVDPVTGMVYQTEDRHDGLMYRFIPNERGRLSAGGRLQALALDQQPSFDTHNWGPAPELPVNEWRSVRWIDLENTDTDDDDLRQRGYEAGAARFARGEGLCYADGSVFMTATIGGAESLGQVFELQPGNGRLRLLHEAAADSILHHADNLTMSPWGDLVICEDTEGGCGLIGMTPDGRQYPLADNPYTDSELAGVCFSPDGVTLFVNVQYRGLTLAISGPWPRSA